MGNNSHGISDHRTMIRNIFIDHGPCPYLYIISDMNTAKNYRIRIDIHIISQNRLNRPVLFLRFSFSYGDAVSHCQVFSRLIWPDHTKIVIDPQSWANFTTYDFNRFNGRQKDTAKNVLKEF